MGRSPGKWIKTMLLLLRKKTMRSSSTKGRNASGYPLLMLKVYNARGTVTDTDTVMDIGMQKAGSDNGHTVAKGPPASTGNSPVISEPVLVDTHNNGINPELEKGNSSILVIDASLVSCNGPGPENQGIAGHALSNDGGKFGEEQAAVKAQAVFRGFLEVLTKILRTWSFDNPEDIRLSLILACSFIAIRVSL